MQEQQQQERRTRKNPSTPYIVDDGTNDVPKTTTTNSGTRATDNHDDESTGLQQKMPVEEDGCQKPDECLKQEESIGPMTLSLSGPLENNEEEEDARRVVRNVPLQQQQQHPLRGKDLQLRDGQSPMATIQDFTTQQQQHSEKEEDTNRKDNDDHSNLPSDHSSKWMEMNWKVNHHSENDYSNDNQDSTMLCEGPSSGIHNGWESQQHRRGPFESEWVMDNDDECTTTSTVHHHRHPDGYDPQSPVSSEFLLSSMLEWTDDAVSVEWEQDLHLASSNDAAFDDDPCPQTNGIHNIPPKKSSGKRGNRRDCTTKKKKPSVVITKKNHPTPPEQHAYIMALSQEDRQRYEHMIQLESNQIREAVQYITIPRFDEILRQYYYYQEQPHKQQRIQQETRTKKRNAVSSFVSPTAPTSFQDATSKVKRTKRCPAVPVQSMTTTITTKKTGKVHTKKKCSPTTTMKDDGIPKVRKKNCSTTTDQVQPTKKKSKTTTSVPKVGKKQCSSTDPVQPKTSTTAVSIPKVDKKKCAPKDHVHPKTTAATTAAIPKVNAKKYSSTYQVHPKTMAGSWIDELSRRIASYMGAIADDPLNRGYRPPVTPSSGDHHQRSFLNLLRKNDALSNDRSAIQNSHYSGFPEPSSVTRDPEVKQHPRPPQSLKRAMSLPLLPCLTPHAEGCMPTNTTPMMNDENQYPSSQRIAWPSREVLLQRNAWMCEPSMISSTGRRSPSKHDEK
jgi:hypothetical protein